MAAGFQSLVQLLIQLGCTKLPVLLMRLSSCAPNVVSVVIKVNRVINVPPVSIVCCINFYT